jgi:hypothetical protein
MLAAVFFLEALIFAFLVELFSSFSIRRRTGRSVQDIRWKVFLHWRHPATDPEPDFCANPANRLYWRWREAANLHAFHLNMRLTESDLKFVVETVATRRRDHDHIINLIRDKDDLLEPMLEDPKLTERLLGELEVLVRVSPYLMFSVLLRRVRHDLDHQSFVLERDAHGKRIPIFEAAQAGQMLGDSTLREYLTDMLCSFVRTNVAVLYRQEGRSWQKRKFSDMDMDDMMALCQLVESELKPRFYKRIADIALFLTGVYPDHASFFVRRPRSQDWRRVPDYEREGRRFYTLAAQDTDPPGPASVFEKLAEKFTLARGVLNTLSDHYLKPIRARCFDQPDGA